MAGAKAVCQLREGVAVTEESKFNLGVIDRRQRIQHRLYLADPVVDDVAGEQDVANRRSKKHEAVLGRAGYAAVERVVDGGGRATPEKRLGRVEVEAYFCSFCLEGVKGLLQILLAASQRDVVEKGNAEEKIWDVGFDVEEYRV